jgi:hypothetical protein
LNFFSSETPDSLIASYIGRSQLDRMSMFKSEIFKGSASNLADIFDGATSIEVDGLITIIDTYPALISTWEDTP